MHARTTSAAAAAALALMSASAGAAPKTIEPGFWETTNRVVSPFPTKKTDRRCIRPADVEKFMEGPGNHIYHCTYPTKSFEGGKILLKGSCKSRDRPPFPIQGQGTYSAEAFHLEARATPTVGPVKIPVHAVTDAKRLSATCPTPDAALTSAARGPDATAGNEPGNSQ